MSMVNAVVWTPSISSAVDRVQSPLTFEWGGVGGAVAVGRMSLGVSSAISVPALALRHVGNHFLPPFTGDPADVTWRRRIRRRAVKHQQIFGEDLVLLLLESSRGWDAS